MDRLVEENRFYLEIECARGDGFTTWNAAKEVYLHFYAQTPNARQEREISTVVIDSQKKPNGTLLEDRVRGESVTQRS